ncbi:MAG: hypothetical protein O7F76_08560 [Planctomycetota bacterium]|nr:hypothetical protein [Planctomycetota bacterium]
MVSQAVIPVRFVHGGVSFPVLIGVVAILGVIDTAPAHLSIIRQGLESRGVREFNDEFGRALAAGDFNGDGFVDLATGTPLEDLTLPAGAANDAGAVIINYGVLTGLTTLNASLLTQDNLGYTSEDGDRFGASLAVGNFNGDAFDDLAIGSPGESIDFNGGAGNVIIVYGGPNGLDGNSSSDLVSQKNSPGAVEVGDAFGFAVAAGRFNGDNKDDLAVGIPGEDLGSGGPVIVEAGAIELYFGSATGVTTAGAYIITDDDTINPAQAGAAYGFALAAGNFDGDAFTDLAVGAPGKNTSGPRNHGVVEILYGTGAGIGTAGAQLLNATSFGSTVQPDEQFGYSIATGHSTDDNFDDLAVGAPFRPLVAGRVFYVKGSATGIDTATAFSFGQPISSPGDTFAFAIDMGDWNGNGFDDLAVGIPGKSSGAGQVNIYAASDGGTGIISLGPTIETQEVLNEVSENSDRLGEAVAFGAFAGGTRKALAIGAPGENWDPMPGNVNPVVVDAGAVYIDMPWLQAQNLSCRASMLTNCVNDVVFSQKPFEPHLLASISKIMTALLAVESTQGGCNPCSNLGSVYTVPAVLCDSVNQAGGTVGGSDAGLCAGEQITLNELLQGLLYPSGNDCAFSIADLLFNPGTTCSDTACADIVSFVALMNTRAQGLGMSQANFENPSGAAHGSWPSQNFASPNDMARLAFFAMQNPLFTQYISAPSGSIIRNSSPCFTEGAVSNFCTGAFPIAGCGGPDFPNGSGLKGGSTPPAGRTFVASVDHPEGRFFAVALGAPSSGALAIDVNALLTLGANTFCQGPFVPQPPPPGSTLTTPNVPSNNASDTSFVLPLDFPSDRAANVRVGLSQGTPSALARLVMTRNIQVLLQPGESATCTIAPFEGHGGVEVTNLGVDRADLQVVYAPPGIVDIVNVPAGGLHRIAPFAGSAASGDLEVTNISSTAAAFLEIGEAGYEFDLALNDPSTAFQVRMTADPLMGEDQIHVRLIGLDQNPDAEVDITLSQTFDDDPNCDQALSTEDIPAFVVALIDPAAYAVLFPYCYIGSADRNNDGKINGEDVRAFVEDLTGP